MVVLIPAERVSHGRVRFVRAQASETRSGGGWCRCAPSPRRGAPALSLVDDHSYEDVITGAPS